MKNEILNFLRENPQATFQSLSKYVPGFEGEHTMSIADHPSIIIWDKVSQDAINALEELQISGEIQFDHAEPLTSYLIDGKELRLPRATEVKHYSSPHWLPVTVSIRVF